jgi:UrcA family protein
LTATRLTHPVVQHLSAKRFRSNQEIVMSRIASKLIHVAAAVVVAASQAHAAAPPSVVNQDTVSTTVHFGDLNLDRPAGITALYRRLNIAAERDCGEPQLTGTHVVSQFWRSCVAQAVDGAVRVLDRPALTAYHRAHTKQSDRDGTVARR